jgi:integrase
VQRRDIRLFVSYMVNEEGREDRVAWSPRLSKAFQEWMRKELVDGRRRWSDRTVNRVMAHLKTFAKWIHKLKPFPLGNPMEKIRLQPLGTGLEVERALTASERRKIIDAADLLVEIGGRSRDRGRYRGAERPKTAPEKPGRRSARSGTSSICTARMPKSISCSAICDTNSTSGSWQGRLTARRSG